MANSLSCMTKTKRTSKNQLARELAMKARAEELERQNKIMEATKDGFLALGELGPIVARFDAAATALRELGESKRDIAKTFGLSVTVLTMLEQLLPAAPADEEDGAVDRERSGANEFTTPELANHEADLSETLDSSEPKNSRTNRTLDGEEQY